MLRSTMGVLVLALAVTAAGQQTSAATPQPAAAQSGAASSSQASAPENATADVATRPNAKAKPEHRASKRDKVQAQKLFVAGAKDIEHNDVRAAMDAFTRAAELDPEQTKYAVADQIARQHLVTNLIQQSDKDKILGHFADARAKIAEAYSVDPASPEVAQHMHERGGR
jgi:general secretion pathway protein D